MWTGLCVGRHEGTTAPLVRSGFGHGNDSFLGTERRHLAEWRERGW